MRAAAASLAAGLILAPPPLSPQTCLPAETLQDAGIAVFIEKLDSRSFKERAAAHSALLRIGYPALPALRAALASSSSPETRMRAGAIRDALHARPLPAQLSRTAAEVSEEIDAVWNAAPGKLGAERYERLIASSDRLASLMAREDIQARHRALDARYMRLYHERPIQINGPDKAWEVELLETGKELAQAELFLRAPIYSRAAFAFSLAGQGDPEKKSRARFLLGEALRHEPGLLRDKFDPVGGRFWLAAEDAGALDDPEFVRLLSRAPGGVSVLQLLRARRELTPSRR